LKQNYNFFRRKNLKTIILTSELEFFYIHSFGSWLLAPLEKDKRSFFVYLFSSFYICTYVCSIATCDERGRYLHKLIVRYLILFVFHLSFVRMYKRLKAFSIRIMLTWGQLLKLDFCAYRKCLRLANIGFISVGA
jgi:hypothetical protein